MKLPSFVVTFFILTPGLCPSGSRTSLCLSRDVWEPLFGIVEFIIADIPGDVVETALGKSIRFLPRGGNQCTPLVSAVSLEAFFCRR